MKTINRFYLTLDLQIIIYCPIFKPYNYRMLCSVNVCISKQEGIKHKEAV